MTPRLLPALVAAIVFAGVAGCGGTSEEEQSASQPGATQPVAPTTAEAAVGPARTPGVGAVPWPAPDDALAEIEAAGLEPLRREFLSYHVHSHLDVFVNGNPVPVPAYLGINIADTGLQSGEPCAEPCISPLHTHDDTGVIHVESADERTFTLAQLFAEWGVTSDDSCVGGYCRPDASIAVHVDGQPYDEPLNEIALLDRREIAIVIGTPPATIPASYDWSAYE